LEFYFFCEKSDFYATRATRHIDIRLTEINFCKHFWPC